MKPLTIISASLLLFLLNIGLGLAVDEYPWPEEYTILCSSEEVTGLNWIKGDWKPIRFKNVQRLIVKSKENDCSVQDGRGDIHMGNYHSKYVCLNHRGVGDEYDPILGSGYCEEHYIGPRFIHDPQPPKLNIYCDQPQIWLSPNGWYHYAHIHGQLDDAPEDDRKDSQYVEVGKCSMIKLQK